MEHNIYTAPYTIGAIIREARSVFSQNLNLIIGISLVVSAPVVVLTIGAGVDPMADTNTLSTAENLKLAGIELFSYLIGLVGFISLLLVTKRSIEGVSQSSVGDTLRESLAYWPRTLGTGIVFGILITLLFLLLIVPGIIFAVYWGFAFAAVVYRNVAGTHALRYSKQMVKGRWWKTFWYFMVIGIVSMALGLIATLPFVFFDGTMVTAFSYITIQIAASFSTLMTALLFLHFDAVRPVEVSALPVDESNEQKGVGEE